MRGSLLVFEGLDGSGKSTQVNLLINYLEDNDISYGYIHFPRYDSKWGKMIKEYLKGNMNRNNPYYIATLYANDRYEFVPQLEEWLEIYDVVICDRYIYSAMAFQGSQLSNDRGARNFLSDREYFMDWLYEYEFRQNKIPKPNKILYFNVTIDFIKNNILDRDVEDIHEKLNFQKKVKKVYENIMKHNKKAEIIDCFRDRFEDNKILNKKEIHHKVVNLLQREDLILN